MKEEFKKFLESPEISPSLDLNDKILSQIHRDLSIQPSWILLKLFLLHGLVGAATLSFCPQFSIGPVGKGITGTLYELMKLHPLLCASFCGLVFLGSSALVSVLALRSSELVWVKRKSWWIYSLLAAISLAFFMVAGSLFKGHFDLEFIFMWTFTAIISAWGIIKMGTWLKIRSWNLTPSKQF